VKYNLQVLSNATQFYCDRFRLPWQKFSRDKFQSLICAGRLGRAINYAWRRLPDIRVKSDIGIGIGGKRTDTFVLYDAQGDIKIIGKIEKEKTLDTNSCQAKEFAVKIFVSGKSVPFQSNYYENRKAALSLEYKYEMQNATKGFGRPNDFSEIRILIEGLIKDLQLDTIPEKYKNVLSPDFGR
jgi:hypothetical protein